RRGADRSHQLERPPQPIRQDHGRPAAVVPGAGEEDVPGHEVLSVPRPARAQTFIFRIGGARLGHALGTAPELSVHDVLITVGVCETRSTGWWDWCWAAFWSRVRSVQRRAAAAPAV